MGIGGMDVGWVIHIGKLLVLMSASWSFGSGHYGLSGAMFCAVIAAELLHPTNGGKE